MISVMGNPFMHSGDKSQQILTQIFIQFFFFFFFWLIIFFSSGRGGQAQIVLLEKLSSSSLLLTKLTHLLKSSNKQIKNACLFFPFFAKIKNEEYPSLSFAFGAFLLGFSVPPIFFFFFFFCFVLLFYFVLFCFVLFCFVNY